MRKPPTYDPTIKKGSLWQKLGKKEENDKPRKDEAGKCEICRICEICVIIWCKINFVEYVRFVIRWCNINFVEYVGFVIRWWLTCNCVIRGTLAFFERFFDLYVLFAI